MNFHSVILAPVMPVWDKGTFCSSLKNLFLERGFRVTLLDTLSLFSSNSTIEVIPSLIAELKDRFREPFILVGFAMAGTLVQMLAAKLPNAQAVLAVNAPGYPDKLLQQRLGYLLTLLESGDLSGALEILDAFVQPIGAIKKRTLLKISDEQKSMAIERMTRGFKLLLEMDARDEIIKYTGKFLALVGEKSQLATVENQTRSHCMNHEYKIISGAGMRLWEDNPTMTDAIIDEWIDEL
ncbi:MULTISPECIES: alpha/beta hydrolase [Bartonella]|uniref:Pimeloyl-ACP methyl ester carboxylesterase n=1 Tax=Bartonella japonica TaxID=357761 RepID=A0ABV2FQB3_9HYPH